MKTHTSRGRVGDEPNPIDKYVGARVRMYRSLKGMSQEKLAESLGLTFQQVQKYETGDNRISASRLWDISQVLETPVSLFYQDMSSEITSLSPRHIKTDNVTQPNNVFEQITQSYDNDPMTKRETLSLVRAYYRIPNRELAHKILELMKMFAYTDEAAEEQELDEDPENKKRKKP